MSYIGRKLFLVVMILGGGGIQASEACYSNVLLDLVGWTGTASCKSLSPSDEKVTQDARYYNDRLSDVQYRIDRDNSTLVMQSGETSSSENIDTMIKVESSENSQPLQHDSPAPGYTVIDSSN